MNKELNLRILKTILAIILVAGGKVLYMTYKEMKKPAPDISIRIMSDEEQAKRRDEEEIHKLRYRQIGRPMTGEEIAKRLMMTPEELLEEERLRLAALEKEQAPVEEAPAGEGDAGDVE